MNQMKYLTRQEIFTKVKTHLLKQGKKSWLFGACAYRGEDGTSCAVGCLIPDELYSPNLEGEGVTSPAFDLLFERSSGWNVHFTHRDLLLKLQYIHDNHPPRCWAMSLSRLAEQEGFDE